jgi:hypothetical protein
MTDEDKIKALAELDGRWPNLSQESLRYLTSYDAIIPLIQKQPMGIRVTLEKNCTVFDSAEQLCEALLRATRKYKE